MRVSGHWRACVAVLAAVVCGGCAVAPATAAQPSGGRLTASDVSPAGDQVYDALGGLRFDPNVPTPESVLGHRIGERFTRHHERVRYCRELAAASDRVRFQHYGSTHQRRDLVILTISSPENLERLDEILAANRELTDPSSLTDERAEEIFDNNPAIVWYSFGVHGNEASCGEVSMQLAYTLAAATNERVREILDNTVIVIDPQLNPDGQMRYVSWYENTVGVSPNASRDAAEHDEPWPGGRTNHYLFDLNRDWVWGVHPESRARVTAYRRYMPQLHLDYHEQGHTNPYFLGAGDKPYNANIPEETKEWVRLYGRENGRAFDLEGIEYATAERFDYLYPGYGKVLPVYHGAVGLLLEKGGHGRAGLAIEVDDQNTLTLAERVRHHFITAMNYAEVTTDRRRGQLERFRRFFADASRGAGPGPTQFVVSSANDPAMLGKLWSFCAMHGIKVRRTEDAASIHGLWSYETGRSTVSVDVPAGSWLIDARQPMGNLVRAMFERETFVEDPDTYDITSWTLPIAFGLDAWYAGEPVIDATGTVALNDFTITDGEITGDENAVAVIVDASQHHFPAAVGVAVEMELSCRILGEAVEVGGRRFGAGSLVVPVVRNRGRDLAVFAERVATLGVNVHRTGESWAESGPSLGNNRNTIMTPPKVLLLTGPGTSSYSFGQHWHLLDIEQPFPHTRVNVSDLGSVDLDEYTVLVMPDMSGLSESVAERVKRWVQSGGVVVASDSAAVWAARELAGAEPKPDRAATDKPKQLANAKTWAERETQSVEDRVSGAMALVRLDETHPLAVGVRPWMGVLVRGATILPMRDDAYVVARYDTTGPIVSGPVSEENSRKLAGSPFMVHHRVGRGAVISIAEDVTIRGFHHAGMRLLMNAIVYGPTLGSM